MIFYFIIPTINGEIFGKPYISFSLEYDFNEEVTIYKITFDYFVIYLYVSEVNLYDK